MSTSYGIEKNENNNKSSLEMNVGPELENALKYLDSITNEAYSKNKEEINGKVFNLLYKQPKFFEQGLLVDKINTTIVNNFDIFMIIRNDWKNIPKIFRDKFFYFIEISLPLIPHKVVMSSELEIKNFILSRKYFDAELVKKDILETTMLSTLNIYKSFPEMFEKEWVSSVAGRKDLGKYNRAALFDILELLSK